MIDRNPTYVVITLTVLFGIAMTPHGRWLTLGAYSLGIFTLFISQRVAWAKILPRVAVELFFLSLILLGSLWQRSGSILWQWGWLSITSGGLTILGTTLIKASLSLLLVNALQQQLTLPQFLGALHHLRFPPLLVAIMGTMLRYVELVQAEFKQMQAAATARNGLATGDNTRRVVAQMIKGGFIRTLQRGEVVHQAMVARGYSGQIQLSPSPPITPKDYGVICVVFCLSLLPHLFRLKI